MAMGIHDSAPRPVTHVYIQRSVTHDFLRCINILTYLLTYPMTETAAGLAQSFIGLRSWSVAHFPSVSSSNTGSPCLRLLVQRSCR